MTKSPAWWVTPWCQASVATRWCWTHCQVKAFPSRSPMGFATSPTMSNHRTLTSQLTRQWWRQAAGPPAMRRCRQQLQLLKKTPQAPTHCQLLLCRRRLIMLWAVINSFGRRPASMCRPPGTPGSGRAGQVSTIRHCQLLWRSTPTSLWHWPGGWASMMSSRWSVLRKK